ncbi:MAG TPA: hypothetical protein VGJ20_14530 [Xanthobacteraceae bacterium]
MTIIADDLTPERYRMRHAKKPRFTLPPLSSDTQWQIKIRLSSRSASPHAADQAKNKRIVDQIEF